MEDGSPKAYFSIQLMYDLPSTANLVKWVKWGKSKDAACSLCSRGQTLEHVLVTCIVAQGQGQWWHHKVLTELAAIVDFARLQVNKTGKTKPKLMLFLKARQTPQGKITLLVFSHSLMELGDCGGPERS